MSGCSDRKAGELLAAYELGILSPEERRHFESHLGGCAVCMEELYESAPAMTALLADPDRSLRALSAAGAAPAERRPFRAALRRRRVWIPAAAAAMILAAVFFFPSGPGRYGSMARIEPVLYVPLETRGAPAAEPSLLFREAMKSYARGDYEGAAPLLAGAIGVAREEGGWRDLDQARFFHGLTLLLSGNAEEAVEPLRLAARSSTPVIAERSRWYLAQSHLLLEDPERARAHLEWLSEFGVRFSRSAAEQLGELPDRVDSRR